MRTTIFGLIAGLTILLSATPISAHHAFSAEFDADRPMQLHGTVTKTEWINPHSVSYTHLRAHETDS